VAIVKEDGGGFSETNPVFAAGGEQVLLNRFLGKVRPHVSQVRAPERLPCVVIDRYKPEVQGMLPGEAIHFVLHRLQPTVREPQIGENDELDPETVLEILQCPSVIVGDVVLFTPVVEGVM
jgi:hypothetical protein